MATKYKQNRTIVLPICETNYQTFITVNEFTHKTISTFINQIPKCFPVAIENGRALNGFTRQSKKSKLQMRKIEIGKISYRIRPSFILPYQ